MRLNRNEIKLSFEEPRFYVDKQTRTIKCKLFFSMLSPIDFDGEIKIPMLPRTCVNGRAYCYPEDVFDVEIGKKIALARAENKAYRNAFMALREKCQNYKDCCRIMEDFMLKATNCNLHNDSYITQNS